MTKLFNALAATIAVSILIGLPSVTSTLNAQGPAPVDYDTFMKQDVQSRIAMFNGITPENRADLVHTQIQRWVEANRERLTPEQLGLTQEWLDHVTADNYRESVADDLKAERMVRAKDLETRAAKVFSKEDMMQALTIHGSHIPRK